MFHFLSLEDSIIDKKAQKKAVCSMKHCCFP